MMPRKKSRRIVVDGTAFRWMISHSFPDLVVQSESGGSSLLARGVRSRTYDSDYDWYKYDPVTPRSVASVIRHAINSGWKHDVKGSAFSIDVEDLLKYVCPTCGERVIRNDHPDYECGANVIRELMES